MKLRLAKGDYFRSDENDINFRILEIDEEGNTCKVRCYHEDMEWEEDWDDLDNVYNALEIGEYHMLERECEMGGKTITMPFFPIYNTGSGMVYCGNPEVKNRFGVYKNSGKPRKKRRK